MEPPGPVRGWQSWLVNDRPGLRQFAIGALALVLPVVAFAVGGASVVIPAMAVSATLGVGLGLGWTLVYSRTWFIHAPVSTIGVFAICFASFLHLALIPSWDLLLRERHTLADMHVLVDASRAGLDVEVPRYDSGGRLVPLQVAIGGSGPSRRVLVYTPEPLQRWTPFGYAGRHFLVIEDDRKPRQLDSLDALNRVIAALHREPPSDGTPGGPRTP